MSKEAPDFSRGRGCHAKEWLGDIKWYGAWWCYVFEPDGQTIYEKKCLRDIAQFLDDLTAEWKAGRKHV